MTVYGPKKLGKLLLEEEDMAKKRDSMAPESKPEILEQKLDLPLDEVTEVTEPPLPQDAEIPISFPQAPEEKADVELEKVETEIDSVTGLDMSHSNKFQYPHAPPVDHNDPTQECYYGAKDAPAVRLDRDISKPTKW
jgi:hypothetical protein